MNTLLKLYSLIIFKSFLLKSFARDTCVNTKPNLWDYPAQFIKIVIIYQIVFKQIINKIFILKEKYKD